MQTTTEADVADSPNLSPPHHFITGTCHTAKEGEWISIIGNPGRKTQTLTLRIGRVEDRSPVLDLADDILDKDDTDGHRAATKRWLSGNKATASIGFAAADREYGHPDLWFFEIYVAVDTFQQLVADIREGRVHSVRLFSRFANLFIDDPYARASDPVLWFLPPGSKQEAEMAVGLADSIGWTEVSPNRTNSHAAIRQERPDDMKGTVADTAAEATVAQAIAQLQVATTNHLDKLAREVRRWALVLAGMLALVLLLRR